MLKRATKTGLLRICGAATQLLLMFSVARLTGAEQAGLFYFGFSILIITSTVCRLGSELSALREVSGFIAKHSAFELRRCLLVRCVVTLAVSLCASILIIAAMQQYLNSLFLGLRFESTMLAFAWAVPALALLGIFSEVLKAADRAEFAVFLQNVVVPLLAVAFLLGSDFFGQVNAVTAALGVLISSWAGLFISALVWFGWWSRWSAGRNLQGDSFHEYKVVLVQVIRDAPALVVVATASVIMQWTGSVILGFMASPSDVSGFSVAVRLAIAVSIVNSAVMSIISPKLAAAYAEGNLVEMERLAHITSILVVVTAAPALLALLLAPEIWLSFFGAEFKANASELRVLVVAQILAALIGHSGTILVMAGQYSFARQTSVIAVVFQAILMAVLVPSFGVYGAAIAMSCGVAAGHLLGLVLVRLSLGFWSMPTNFRRVRHILKEDAE